MDHSITLVCAAEMRRAVEALADEEDRTLSAIVRVLVREALHARGIRVARVLEHATA